jgi:hypothetical protein
VNGKAQVEHFGATGGMMVSPDDVLAELKSKFVK